MMLNFALSKNNDSNQNHFTMKATKQQLNTQATLELLNSVNEIDTQVLYHFENSNYFDMYVENNLRNGKSYPHGHTSFSTEYKQDRG